MKIASFLGISYLIASTEAAVPLARREAVSITVTDYTTLTTRITMSIYVDPTLPPVPEATSTSSTNSNTSPATDSVRVHPPCHTVQSYMPPTTTLSSTPTETPSRALVQQTVAVEQPPPQPLTTAPAAAPSPPPSSSSSGGATDYSSNMNGVSAVPGGSALAGGSCAPGSPCSGDMTYYATGLGACGIINDGENEYVAALQHDMMGTKSNDNPFCGKTLNVKYGGKVIKVKVVDKCMGCKGQDIDLSVKAFGDLADMSLGRVKCTWWFD